MKRGSAILVLAVSLSIVHVRADAPAPANQARPIENMIDQLKLLAELVRQLDDPKFAVRQAATERLMRTGQPAMEPLRRVLEGNPTLETATRITSILKSIDREQSGGNKLRDKLAERVYFKNIDPDRDISLKDALQWLSGDYGVPISLDEAAFAAIGVPQAGERPVQLQIMVGVPLRLGLQKMLAQIKGEEYRGTFLIRDDQIEVTTTYHVNPIHWVGAARQEVPTISCDFDHEPLAEAVRRLGESTGISVVVDPRVADKAVKTVTAELNDVPLDSAVRLLANMVGLRVVSLEKVLYVTSRENAQELEAEKNPGSTGRTGSRTVWSR